MTEFAHTAVVGAGVIGASWAALFLASGRTVSVYDPSPTVEQDVKAYVANAWPTLTALGLANCGDPDLLTFHPTAAAAVEGADFIQENVPERLPVKVATYQEIEPALAPHAIVSSSASGLTLSQMQTGWRSPKRFVLGHPFNPPHLIPLVEVMGNALTDPAAIDGAETFYRAVGKVTIRLQKEMNGHVANRLQAALWREAIHLVLEGVATVEDVDKAVWAGPGARWAAMGPTSLFNLGAGPGGLPAYFAHFKDTFNGWWSELGEPVLNEETIAQMVKGLDDATVGKSVAELSSERDALIVAMQTAAQEVRKP